jgi:hypothetical protein
MATQNETGANINGLVRIISSGEVGRWRKLLFTDGDGERERVSRIRVQSGGMLLPVAGKCIRIWTRT